MTFICSECGRVIDPNCVHMVGSESFPDGIGCELKDPKGTLYNICFDCLCKFGIGELRRLKSKANKLV